MRHLRIHMFIMIFTHVFKIASLAFARNTNASPVESYRSGWEAFESIALNNCNGENVYLTGVISSTMQFTEDGSGAGLDYLGQLLIRGFNRFNHWLQVYGYRRWYLHGKYYYP
jgi:hypothetical protein